MTDPKSPLFTRRRSLRNLAWCVSAWGLMAGWARAAQASLPVTASMPESLQVALQRKQPLVVMVSLDGCPFCKVVRENYLMPLQREGLPVVQLNMRSAQPIVDFDGSPQTQDGMVRNGAFNSHPPCCFLVPKAKKCPVDSKGHIWLIFMERTWTRSWLKRDKRWRNHDPHSKRICMARYIRLPQLRDTCHGVIC